MIALERATVLPSYREHTRYLRRISPPPAMRDRRWHLVREIPRTMYPGEFLDLIRRHRHSHWDSCGVERNRWGDRPRNEFNLPPFGTLWFSTPDDRDYVWPLRASGLPYVSVQDVTMLENGVTTSGEVVRGWRSALAALLQGGYISPCDRLSRLIGEDAFAVAETFQGWNNA